MEDSSTHGLRPDQLAGLFSVGLDDSDAAQDKSMIQLLHSRLTYALPSDSLLFDALTMMMGRLGCDVRSLAGSSLIDVLLNPRSDIGLLYAIKDCSKRLSFGLESKVEAGLATTTYYAAVASALVHHDRRITGYSYEALDRSFAAFAAKEWVGPELAGLFSRAQRICHDKRGADDERARSPSE
ncbi:MAG: hypothetical protein JW955_25125 [Sedimentisphaerales bacterium]|nr:hypothetical protein [Sedimentisphaerales bacterium]